MEVLTEDVVKFNEFRSKVARHAFDESARWGTACELAIASPTGLEDLGVMVKQFEALAEARKAEAKRLVGLQKDAEQMAQMLRDVILVTMQERGLEAVMGDSVEMVIAPAGGTPAVIVDKSTPEHEVVIPGKYWKPCEISKATIAADLSAGVELPFARFAPRKTVLRIN